MTIFAEFDRQEELKKLVTSIRSAEAVIPSHIEDIDKNVAYLTEQLNLFESFIASDLTTQEDVDVVLSTAGHLLALAASTLEDIQKLVTRAQALGIALPDPETSS